MTADHFELIGKELKQIFDDSILYFDRHIEAARSLRENQDPYDRVGPDPRLSTKEEKGAADNLTRRLITAMGKLSQAVKVSLLHDESDLRELVLNTKKMRSALYFRQYFHWDVQPIDDEGSVLGVRPSGQSEESFYRITDAKAAFINAHEDVLRVATLLTPGTEAYSFQSLGRNERVTKYRPNTAFIMMWMDRDHPELDDVRDTIKSVFDAFSIRALRADDIEHEDVITKRILDEIETSEFLIADLTGARPSVYYEVGYAHALGRRVILYRKKGTSLHFDLAVHNCPEYENLGDLRVKLKKRLQQLTNKNPQ